MLVTDRQLFLANPNLVVVFDDFSYHGVKTIYEEIVASGTYSIHPINENQFMVYLSKETI